MNFIRIDKNILSLDFVHNVTQIANKIYVTYTNDKCLCLDFPNAEEREVAFEKIYLSLSQE